MTVKTPTPGAATPGGLETERKCPPHRSGPTAPTQAPSLWPHQRAACAAIHSAIDRGQPSGMVSMPTGSGKTFVFCSVARDLGAPTLVLIHRDELVIQTVDTLSIAWPDASVGVIKAARDEWQDGQQVVIASVQSLHNGRLGRMPRNRFGLVIADECHHAVAASWRAAIDHFNDRRFLLGVSATPERFDGVGLAELFGDKPLYSYPLRQAIADRILCKLTQYGVSTSASLDSVSTRGGDFALGELSQAVNTSARNAVIVETFQEYAADRRAVAFTVDVQHARDLVDAFNGASIAASIVHGAMDIDERRHTLQRFAAGDIRVLCNCMVLTEGYDDKGVDCILMARPTRSRSLYTQAVGRGLRRADGKDDCIVIDYVDNSRRHKLVTALDLFGKTVKTDADGEDVIEVVDQDLREQEERSEIESLTPLTWRLERVCPWPEVPSLKGYVPTKPWHEDAASPKQIKFLQGLGLATDRDLTKGEVSYLLDRSLEFRTAFPSPPTPKQRWFLKQRGAWDENLTFDQARELIGRLKRGAA